MSQPETIDLHLRESNQAIDSPKTKPAPKSSSIPVPFTYFPSDDGTDENLLILLHGLGDTQIPFGKLGRQLKLPQTATLALRAPDQIPFLYEPAFQWYTSFDPLGDLLTRPDPTPALNLLATVLQHLTADCAWPPHRIHIFGFAQGGSVALESCIRWWRYEVEAQQKHEREQKHVHGEDEASEGQLDPSSSIPAPRALGSVVTVSGSLLSHPTLSAPCPTHVLVFHRTPPSELYLAPVDIRALHKAFGTIREVKNAGDGMPRSRDEWEPIMRFWSENLGKRRVSGEGLYEVMVGGVQLG